MDEDAVFLTEVIIDVVVVAEVDLDNNLDDVESFEETALPPTPPTAPAPPPELQSKLMKLSSWEVTSGLLE